MKQVWKYAIPTERCFQLNIPCVADILDVQIQKGGPCLWILVDPHSKRLMRRFAFFETAEEIDDSDQPLAYVGTYQFGKGEVAMHLFQKDWWTP